MKIAIVHDQLREFGGAERVLVTLKQMYPEADVYTSTSDIDALGEHKELVKDWKIYVSWFGKIPIMNRLYSPFRFLTPWIWESFDFSGYDLVISSTGSWMCKGIKTTKPTVHVSYIHHPPRYLYGYETAIEWQKYLIVKIYGTVINHFLRLWDFEASQRPDLLIANSIETKKRIEKFYRREATVIYPPVNMPPETDISNVVKNPAKRTYFITVSRLAKAKHVDLLIKAANKNKLWLKIVGVGRELKYLHSIAGNTVELLGNITDEKLYTLYQGAKAFIFAAVDEEFGIAPIEAMSYGIPVIAYASGGLKETVMDGKNGYLFDRLIESSLMEKIYKLNKLSKIEYGAMRKNARLESEKYSESIFKNKIRKLLNSLIR